MPAITNHCSPARGNNCTWQLTTHYHRDVNCWIFGEFSSQLALISHISPHPFSLIWWKDELWFPSPTFVPDCSGVNLVFVHDILNQSCAFGEISRLQLSVLKCPGTRQSLPVSCSETGSDLWPSERTGARNRKKLLLSLRIGGLIVFLFYLYKPIHVFIYLWHQYWIVEYKNKKQKVLFTVIVSLFIIFLNVSLRKKCNQWLC